MSSAQIERIERELVRDAVAGLLGYALDGRVVLWNPRMAALSGISAREALGRPVVELLPQAVARGEATAILGALGGARGESAGLFFARAPEREFEAYHGVFLPVLDDAGAVVAAAGRIVDITAERRSEARIRESEDRFRIMADGAPAYLWMAGNDGRCTYFNQAWLAFTGRAMEAELGFGWAEGIHPEDFQPTIDTYMTAFNARQPFSMDYRLRRADGEYRWVQDNGVPRLTPDGGFLGYIGSCIDITDRKQVEEVLRHSEEQYHTLAETIPQIVWRAGEDGQIDYMNQRWEEYAGLGSAGVQALGWHQVLHPDDAPAVTRAWAECLASGKPLEVECRLAARHGSADRWFLVRAQRVRAAGGVGAKWYGTCTDIDEQRRVSRLKDEFLATVSHELRTPLNIILGHASLLAADLDLSADAREAAGVIQRHARIQARLIVDLLDASSILSGRFAIEAREVELDLVVRQTVDSFRLAAGDRRIRLDLGLPERPVVIVGDSHRLQQVVRNLLANAIKFTPREGVIRTALTAAGDLVTLIVQDSGRGVDKGFLPHAFERFRQEDSSIRRQFGGMGLGLAIVREIVERHGGTVRIDSNGRGQGTTVTVCLPAAPRQNAQPGSNHDPQPTRLVRPGAEA